MKKTFITLFMLCLALTTIAQEWTSITSSTPATFKTQLVSSSEDQIQVKVQVPGFYVTAVTTPRGEAYVISMPKAVSTAQAGEPNVPMTGIPVMIGDRARMDIRVVNAQYKDFEGIEVAPSKGDFPRTIDPATVPYTYGECYSQDAFFPASNVGMYDPYIIRDFRGQNMVVYPFAYNPVTKTLRVYYDMTVEMYKLDDNGENVMETRRSNVVKLDPDFKSMYQRHFINYEAGISKYTPLEETGDLLIICHNSFMSAMTDFVNWKKTRGVNTTLVSTNTTGTTAANIKTYIQNQYNANNNLTHVLLVGDVAQIPGNSFSAYVNSSNDYSGYGDNLYGQIVGSDIYNDVIIGRFSASTAARVTTQCNRAITYERDLTTSASWLQKGVGISRKENGSGHNNEDDYQHMNNIRTDLLNYGYTTVTQRYANLTGYDASASTISSDINSGAGIVNYANHGQETAWGASMSGYVYYSNDHVNALTNENKLPFIFSVACLVGKYDHSTDCFAEAWMNATNNNNPTGAVGTLMSYISQPWIPPMWAQDECIDILVGNSSTSTSQKYTFGGICINGLMGIFDHYATTDKPSIGTYQAWIVYGDPSLMVRTKTPQAMTVTHDGTIMASATTYTVNVTNGNGSLATITDANHNILGRATVSNNTATISINGTLTAGQTLTLCVFGYNKVTDIQQITVANPAVAPTVTTTAISAIDKTTATGGGNVTADGGAIVTARGICWSTSQNPTVSGSHTTDGTGTGSFTSSMTGLTANTTYYVRAYATNSAGTAYGEELSFTTLPDGIPGDVDGNGTLTMYDAVLILRHSTGGNQLTGQALLNADLNGDGNVTMYDAVLLLRMVVNQ
jgi:gingipain R